MAINYHINRILLGEIQILNSRVEPTIEAQARVDEVHKAKNRQDQTEDH